MTDPDVEFAVPGIPRPEGSTRYVGHRKGKPVVIHDDPQLIGWRKDVRRVASKAMRGRPFFIGRIGLWVMFVMPRPKVLPIGRVGPVVIPDLDKLVRGVGDALSTVCYKDDAQVTELTAEKRYPYIGEQPGVIVRLRALDPQPVGLFDAESLDKQAREW